ncbi:MAG: septal ring lytic transglycosylase RlpA family protein [Bacteroidales bacterium]
MYKFLVSISLFLLCNIVLAQSSHVYHGKATFYAKKFNGRRTYSGEKFSSIKYTAAHRSFPLQSLVKVTNPRNHKSVIVRINDRFHRKNFIDLSLIAAQQIDIIGQGTANVSIQALDTSYMREYKLQSADNIMIEPITDEVTETFPEDTVQYFYIRLASFKLKKTAELLLQKNLPEKYKNNALIQKTSYKSKPLYKVIIGPFASLQEANTQKIKLKKRFKDANVFLKTQQVKR